MPMLEDDTRTPPTHSPSHFLIATHAFVVYTFFALYYHFFTRITILGPRILFNAR